MLTLIWMGRSIAVDAVLDNLPELIQVCKQAVVLVEVPSQIDSPPSLASGVLVHDEKLRQYVVTCRHVLEKEDGELNSICLLRFNLPDTALYTAGKLVEVHPTQDLVLLAVLVRVDSSMNDIEDKSIGRSFYADTSEMREGTRVFLIAYPLGMGKAYKNFPVTRTGIISQVIPRRETFFIEGFVAHGSSGCPVFSARTGKLIGILPGFKRDFIDKEIHIPRPDTTIVDTISIKTPYNTV